MDSEITFKKHGSTVKKNIFTRGQFGRKPALTSECNLQLELITQETLTSEYINSNVTNIVIGNADEVVDKLIEACVESMFECEESIFYITKEKPHGCEFQIKICLFSFTVKPYIYEWSDEDKISASNYFKAQGVELYKKGKIKEAFHKFSKSLKFLLMLDSYLESQEESEELSSLRVALYNNLASCQLFHKNYQHTVDLCTKSLNLKPNVKAYYRRALAYIEMANYDKAEHDLAKLLKIEPKNKQALEKYNLVRELDKDNREKYKATVKRMFPTS